MKSTDKLLSEISQFMLMIENDYPEVYRYLDENPITIPNQEHPNVNIEELEGYLQGLKDILERYKAEEGL
ncbi:hypothetical protein [Formosa sp. S-31]|uniref:hypothetical protein n=1 Tax=Formosa sp. S-31 TaxID=2790949 RepID=UPI003EB6EBD4